MTTVRVALLGGPSLMTVVRPPASAAEAASAGLERGAPVMAPTLDRAPRRRPSARDGARGYGRENGRMRVISANVNGIRAAVRRGGLSWLTDAEPDVMCLQEVRASDAQLTRPWRTLALPAGTSPTHPVVPRGARASRCCHRSPHRRVRCELDEEADVAAGRWVEAELDLPTGPVTVVSVYVHTGEAETPRQEEKYRFLDAMTHADEGAGRRRPSRSWWPGT